MYRSAVAWTVLLALAGLPTAAAQQEPVDTCTQMCDPKAEDVNGATIRSGAESVKTVLYFHYQDLLQHAVVNTQPIHGEEENLQGSYLMPTLVTGSDVCCYFKTNDFGAYSTGGLVEIADGKWRVHEEPGVAEDVAIVGKTIPLFFYLSAYPVPQSNSESGILGPNALAVVPQMAVRATMNVGQNPGSGELIAEGDSAKSGRVDVLYLPGGLRKEIYEIRVDLEVKKSIIPSAFADGPKGFSFSVTPYQVDGEGAADAVEFTQAEWRVHVGPKTPPHAVVELANPLSTKSAKASLFNNALFFRWSVLSPWGSYDVDDRSLAISVTGAAAADTAAKGLAPPYVKQSRDHDGHFKPTNVTWKFDYRKAGLSDGTYTVQMSVLNLQHTYRLVETLSFRMEGGVPQDVEVVGKGVAKGGDARAISGKGGDSPGLAGVAAVLALVGVAVMRGRARGPAK